MHNTLCARVQEGGHGRAHPRSCRPDYLDSVLCIRHTTSLSSVLGLSATSAAWKCDKQRYGERLPSPEIALYPTAHLGRPS